jgi:serine/threonine-protein kinase
LFPQIFGKYVLERPLAVGGMARVFLATLRGAGGFEKKLVVKQIRAELAGDEAFVHRFVAEAKTTVELSHPNIVPVYELGAEQGVYYLAMELCDGVTLAQLLERTGRLAPAEGAYVGVEICRALDYAHRKARIIHRDVTPRNVLIDEEGAVRLIDFGIAAPAYSVALDGAGGAREVFGSPGHMPPEQLAGEELGPATDVFAVATLLYEAWSNQAPFRRATAEECERALLQKVPLISSIDRTLSPLDGLIESALARNPAERPQTAEELSRALRRFFADTDFGDVARRLGARVRATREGGEPKAVGDESDAPAWGTEGSKVTHTFATRSMDAVPSVPAQRAHTLDIATRRIGQDRAPAVPLRRRVAMRLAAMTALILGSVALFGAQTWRHRAAAIPPETAEPAVPPTDSAQSLGDGFGARRLPLPPSPPLTQESDPASALAPPAGALSEAPRHEMAHLRITATPRATIEVDGRPRGSTPLSDLALTAGAHLVRLSCAPLGETVSQSLRLEPGESVTVSGDFTGARGRVLVRRSRPN